MARYRPVLVVVALLLVASATPVLAADDDSSIDPDDVEIVSLNGEDTDQVNEFAVRGGERIHVELAGLDAPDRSLYVEVGGTVLGTMDEPEQDVRPRTDADVTTGEQTLRIVREVRDNRTVLARTDVRVTAVDLDDEEETSTTDVDPDDVEIVSLNGEDADRVNEFAVRSDETIRVELAGLEAPDRPLSVEVGGEVVGSMDEPEQDVRFRTDADVETGEQTMAVVWEDRGNRTVLARTDVRVSAVDLDEDDVDPDEVHLDTIDGEDATGVTDIELRGTETIALGLDGIDGDDVYFRVELDGSQIGTITGDEYRFRPRSDADVSEGTANLELVRNVGEERVVFAETEVDVTTVDLERDDDPLAFDPDAVSLATVNGEAPAEVELALRYNETVSIALDGVDVADHRFRVEIGGETVGAVGDGDDEFRPRTDADVETGEQSIAVLARDEGEWTVVAERTITVTDVTLGRESAGDDLLTIDPDSIAIQSVDGEPAEERNALELSRRSPLAIGVEAEELPERGLIVEIDDATIGVLEDRNEEVRLRQDADVETGDGTLRLVHESRGNRTVVAETPVDVIAVDLGDDRPDVSTDDVDLEIAAVNGQPAEGVVVTEYDLRGEIPIELTVDGLAETKIEPTVRYKNDTIPPAHDRYEIEGDRLTIQHLRWVEDGETERLELAYGTGDGEYYVFDDVRVEYRHVEGADLEATGDATGADADGSESGGGVLGGIVDFLGGGGDGSDAEGETAGTTTDRTADDGTTTNAPDRSDDGSGESDGGGVLSTIRDLLGF